MTMRIIPYESFTIESPLPPAMAAKNLAELAQDRLSFLPTKPAKQKFVGRVDANSFKLHRAPFNLSTFTPTIVGEFQPSDAGTSVLVRVWPHGYTISFWIGFASLAIFMFSDMVIAWVFMFFVYTIEILKFSYEVDQAKKMMADVLK
jgi:hypothetical protein